MVVQLEQPHSTKKKRATIKQPIKKRDTGKTIDCLTFALPQIYQRLYFFFRFNFYSLLADKFVFILQIIYYYKYIFLHVTNHHAYKLSGELSILFDEIAIILNIEVA